MECGSLQIRDQSYDVPDEKKRNATLAYHGMRKERRIRTANEVENHAVVS